MKSTLQVLVMAILLVQFTAGTGTEKSAANIRPASIADNLTFPKTNSLRLLHHSLLHQLAAKTPDNSNVAVCGLGVETVLYMANHSPVKQSEEMFQYFSNLPDEMFTFSNQVTVRPGVQLRTDYKDWIASTFNTEVIEGQSVGITWTNIIKLNFQWQIPFDPKRTREMVFQITDAFSIDHRVPGMKLDGALIRYMKKGNCAIVRLDYIPVEGRQYSALIMKPIRDYQNMVDQRSVRDKERAMEFITDPEFVAAVNKDFADESTLRVMDVLLPKFKIEVENDLIGLNNNIIMRKLEAFDLDRIQVKGLRGLAGIQLKQRIFIDVDEQGTKVTSRTDLRAADSHGDGHVYFDSMFAFHIIDTETGFPIISTIVRDPAKTQSLHH